MDARKDVAKGASASPVILFTRAHLSCIGSLTLASSVVPLLKCALLFSWVASFAFSFIRVAAQVKGENWFILWCWFAGHLLVHRWFYQARLPSSPPHPPSPPSTFASSCLHPLVVFSLSPSSCSLNIPTRSQWCVFYSPLVFPSSTHLRSWELDFFHSPTILPFLYRWKHPSLSTCLPSFSRSSFTFTLALAPANVPLQLFCLFILRVFSF